MSTQNNQYYFDLSNQIIIAAYPVKMLEMHRVQALPAKR